MSKKNPDSNPVFRKPKVKTLGLRVPSLPSPHAAFIPQTVVEPATVASSTTVGHSTIVDTTTVVEDHGQTVANATVAQPTTVLDQTVAGSPTVAQSTIVETTTVGHPTTAHSPSYSIVVPAKNGERRMPNYIWWGLKPLLSEQEWYVYDEMWGWTWGFGRESVRISRKWLCSARLGGMTIKQLNRLLGMLSDRGLIVLGDTRNEGPVSKRGTLITVLLPGVDSDTVADPSTVARSTTVGRPTTVSRRTTHDNEEKIEREDRFDVEQLKLVAVRIADSSSRKGIRLSAADLEARIRETVGIVGGVYKDEDVEAVAARFGREAD